MDRFGTNLSLLAIFVCALTSATAFAQTTLDPAREKRRVQEERRKTGAVQRGVTTSQYLNRLMGRKVTYEEVLKNPDDIDLNLAFARTQIRAGDLNGASATLERVLLIKPGNLAVRILYAVILYRLDARNDAEREIRNILKYRLRPGVRAELTGYLEDIAWRNKRTRWEALFHTSYQFETNRNSVPSGTVLASPGGPVFLNGENQATADSAVRGLVRLSLEHKIGGHLGHKLVARVGLYHSEQLRLDRLTLSVADFEGGLVLDLTPVELRILAFTQYLQLSHEPFLVNGGVKVKADWWISKETTLRSSATFDSQHFNELEETVDQARRTGPQVSGTFAVRHKITARHIGSVGLLALRKTANANYWRYYGAGLFARHQWFFGHGMYLLSTASWTYHIHDAPRLTDSSRTRYQHFLRFGTSFGVPLASIVRGGGLPKVFRPVNLSVGMGYERSFSNIRNYQYSNWRFTLGLTRRFAF